MLDLEQQSLYSIIYLIIPLQKVKMMADLQDFMHLDDLWDSHGMYSKLKNAASCCMTLDELKELQSNFRLYCASPDRDKDHRKWLETSINEAEERCAPLLTGGELSLTTRYTALTMRYHYLSHPLKARAEQELSEIMHDMFALAVAGDDVAYKLIILSLRSGSHIWARDELYNDDAGLVGKREQMALLTSWTECVTRHLTVESGEYWHVVPEYIGAQKHFYNSAVLARYAQIAVSTMNPALAYIVLAHAQAEKGAIERIGGGAMVGRLEELLYESSQDTGMFNM